jgi:hypothetical protein
MNSTYYFMVSGLMDQFSDMGRQNLFFGVKLFV